MQITPRPRIGKRIFFDGNTPEEKKMVRERFTKVVKRLAGKKNVEQIEIAMAIQKEFPSVNINEANQMVELYDEFIKPKKNLNY